MPIGIYIAIVALAVVVGMILLGARGRGKLIECPECGEAFKRPAFAEKAGGIGFSLPGLGDFTCPKCNYRARTSSFRSVQGSSDPKTGDKDESKDRNQRDKRE